MADRMYRAGVVGLGMIGAADPVSAEAIGQTVAGLDGTHFEALSDHDQIEVAAGSSRDAGRRERFAERSGATVHADWREMLARQQLDIVSVATYAPVHAEIAVAAAEAGARVVYCEKPIATTLPDAERIVQACERHGALLVVNHQRRFEPGFRRLRDVVAAGELGDLTSASLQWGGGRLGNVGTHTIDAVRMLTGREVVAVSGQLDLSGRPDCRGPQFQDPGGWGMLKMEGGLIVMVDAPDFGTVPLCITINGTLGRATIGGAEARVELWSGKTDSWPATRDEIGPIHRAVREMVDWLDDGTPFPAPGQDAVRTLEAIVAFHASHARGTAWAELPLTGEDRQREVRSG